MDEKKSFLKSLFLPGVGALIAAVVVIFTMSCCNAERDTKAMVIMPDIKVYIRGEIASPGLYKIGADVRLCELMELAGGVTENADVEKLNLAAILTDGTTIDIPAVGSEKTVDPMIAATSQNMYKAGSAEAQQSVTATEKITAGTININAAAASELMRLPGVGQSTAEKIVNYRNSYGGFMTIEEIMNVPGIGEKTFEKMKQYITVE